MNREEELREEYLDSDYDSGSAGYRRFFVDRIVKLESALAALETYASGEICEHRETYRADATSEVCDNCGQSWSDRFGGKPDFVYPQPLLDARKILDGL